MEWAERGSQTPHLIQIHATAAIKYSFAGAYGPKFDICKDCRVFLKVHFYFLQIHETQVCTGGVLTGLHLGHSIGCV